MPRLIPPVLPAGTFRDHPRPRLTTDHGWLLRPWGPEDVPALVAAYDDLRMTAHQPVDRRVVEVMRLERELLRPEVRCQPDRVRALLHPDFQELGAAGAVWTAQAIAEHLVSHEDATTDPLQMEEPTAIDLGPDSILLTYRATSPDQHSLRSSVWVRHHDAWRMLFHQGTHRPPDSESG